MKRIFSLVTALLLIFTLAFSLTSCDRDYDEAEVVAAAKLLLKKAEPLNEIYYGKGLRCDELSIESVGNFKLVLDEELDLYGIKTLNDLKDRTREVFTMSCSEMIFDTRLDPIYDVNGNIIYQARYIEYSPGADNEKFIYVDPNYTVSMTDTVEYYYDTVKVLDVEDLYLYMSVNAKITNEKGECP